MSDRKFRLLWAFIIVGNLLATCLWIFVIYVLLVKLKS